MLNPVAQVEWQNIKAVIFDVDGTLYRQSMLRRMIFARLFLHYLPRPWRWKELKILVDFRRERENHALAPAVAGLENAQYQWGAEASGVSPEKVRELAVEWIHQRPLRLLKRCRRAGLLEFVWRLQRRGIATAIFSDYPARDKAAALGLSGVPAFSSVDPEIDRLKPDPKGLLVIAEKLGLPVSQCLFIGDREDRDRICAENAGMPFLIISPETPGREHCFSGYAELNRQLDNQG